MIRSGDRIATGVEGNRRRLTLEEAEAGGLPDRFTRAEWEAMRRASVRRTPCDAAPWEGVPV